MKRCGICRRWLLPDAFRLVAYQFLLEDRVNCGGDCLRCMRRIEKEWGT